MSTRAHVFVRCEASIDEVARSIEGALRGPKVLRDVRTDGDESYSCTEGHARFVLYAHTDFLDEPGLPFTAYDYCLSVSAMQPPIRRALTEPFTEGEGTLLEWGHFMRLGGYAYRLWRAIGEELGWPMMMTVNLQFVVDVYGPEAREGRSLPGDADGESG